MLIEDFLSIIGGAMVLCIPLFGILAINLAEHHHGSKKERVTLRKRCHTKDKTRSFPTELEPIKCN